MAASATVRVGRSAARDVIADVSGLSELSELNLNEASQYARRENRFKMRADVASLPTERGALAASASASVGWSTSQAHQPKLLLKQRSCCRCAIRLMASASASAGATRPPGPGRKRDAPGLIGAFYHHCWTGEGHDRGATGLRKEYPNRPQGLELHAEV